ncbi:large conductance mechanosensitive channel protein MscL [Laedolimicola ammoniilytica]|uniref:Large-conductance mechanosensitive channel n=1 Tax=Laedolimicola ammoniilytica TaxID=2981771 RepID=A0ABT2RWI3_9FIRM|nr:large conductance mechanosensitive channel protein MscL [Laedolimicola ammoniilytica]MCC2825378.1 large conductance mechanosensitive channel protein MscL [Faecalicatena orotica]MCU6696676.1 large conductance mechanosensitive channel protein MscL [Laedolimicola ammoniilytica]SCH82426.1 Large-conductance mechanosensitive channel [uncultured Clostridium sp.]
MKKFFEEFKKFISRGNVMDMAVGVIIGGAFTAIVNSLVNDIFMPLLSLITGGFDIAGMSVSFGVGDNAATLNYGAFLSAVINFLLIALVIFCIIKAMNTAKDKMLKKQEEEAPAPTTKKCPYCMSEIDIQATRCPHCTSELQ